MKISLGFIRGHIRTARRSVFYRLNAHRNKGKQSCLCRKDIRSISIIGNGPVTHDVSREVDCSDLVIRFNTVGNWGGASGEKFDVWVIANGNPYDRIVGGAPDEKISTLPHEILFTRNATALDLRETPDAENALMAGLHADSSKAIIADNRLHQPNWAISEAAWIRAIREVAMHSDRRMEAFHPSAGILTILLCIHTFTDAEINLCGFGFSGWAGHDWDAERRLLHALAEKGCVKFLDHAPQTTKD